MYDIQGNENETMLDNAANEACIIRELGPHKTMEARFAGFSGDLAFTELDSGEPQGREIF